MKTALRASLGILTLAAAAAPLAGCGRDDEVWFPSCEETRAALTLDEATSLGFSAGEVLAGIPAAYDESLVWTDGSASTPLSLKVSYDGGALSYVHSVAEEPPEDVGAIADIAVICEDRLDLEVGVHLATEDGILDEAWTVTLAALQVDQATFQHDLDPATAGGTYDYRSFDPDDYDEVSAYVRVTLKGAESEGELVELASLVEGEGEDGTASQEAALVGQWASDSE